MDDLPQGEIYLKRKLVSFFEGLGYVDDIFPYDEMTRKQGNRNIEIHLLMDAS